MLYINGRPTFTSPTIQGTVNPGTGLTMPAFTAGGDISLGANKLKTTDLLLKQGSATRLDVKNAADTATLDLLCRTLMPDTSIAYATGSGAAPFEAGNADGAGVAFFARITGSTLQEVARLAGAADPYFGLGVDGAVLKATNAGKIGFFGVATPVAQQAGIINADGTLADITTKFNALIAELEAYGLLAVA